MTASSISFIACTFAKVRSNSLIFLTAIFFQRTEGGVCAGNPRKRSLISGKVKPVSFAKRTITR